MAANTNPKKKAMLRKKRSLRHTLRRRSRGLSARLKSEFLKIVWPDKKTTMGLAGIVIVLTSVISIYLGTVDLLLGKLILRCSFDEQGSRYGEERCCC